LKRVPYWVLDYVLLHELTHLAEAGHTKRFHELVARYPLAERAKGFLIALNMLEHEGADWMQEAGLEEKGGRGCTGPFIAGDCVENRPPAGHGARPVGRGGLREPSPAGASPSLEQAVDFSRRRAPAMV